MAEEKNSKIIQNPSDGHNYKYSSLADLARAGIDIPPMRVVPLFDPNGNPVVENGRLVEYVEALVEGEWVRGSRVIVPSSTRSNEAQNYGSALTYARRYTVLGVFGIACTDDEKIETQSEADQKANEDRAKEELRDLYVKAGGADFDKWFKDNTPKGFDGRTYANMKATLMKQINKKLEGEKKA